MVLFLLADPSLLGSTPQTANLNSTAAQVITALSGRVHNSKLNYKASSGHHVSTESAYHLDASEPRNMYIYAYKKQIKLNT